MAVFSPRLEAGYEKWKCCAVGAVLNHVRSTGATLQKAGPVTVPPWLTGNRHPVGKLKFAPRSDHTLNLAAGHQSRVQRNPPSHKIRGPTLSTFKTSIPTRSTTPSASQVLVVGLRSEGAAHEALHHIIGSSQIAADADAFIVLLFTARC